MTTWHQTDQNWTYNVFPLDIEPETTGEFAPMTALWQSKTLNGRLPAWRDFDLMDFEGWWGWITVYDIVSHDPFECECRLWGSQLARYFGVDMTRWRLFNPDNPLFGNDQLFDDTDVAFFRHLLANHQIGTLHGPITWEHRDILECRIVRFPLADDGKTIDKFFCVAQID